MRQVDSSLVDEWEALMNGDIALAEAEHEEIAPPQPARLTGNVRAFRVLVRNALFQRVLLAARDDIEGLGELNATAGFDQHAWDNVLEEYYDEHDTIGIDAEARSMQYLVLSEQGRTWRARQIFADPAGDKDFGFSATIDLDASDEAGRPSSGSPRSVASTGGQRSTSTERAEASEERTGRRSGTRVERDG